MKKIGLLIFTIAFIGLCGEKALACSCPTVGTSMPTKEKERKFDYSRWLESQTGVVFFGKVIEIKGEDYPSRYKKVRFEIERHWKGVGEKREIVIETYRHSAACGVPYQKGEKYFVATEKHKNRQFTGLCSWLHFRHREAEFQKTIKGTAVKKPAEIVPLPVPHANNAVAQVTIKGKTHIFSFTGLTIGKTWKDTSKQAFMYVEGEKEWRRLPDLPVKLGRLAASAQGVRGKVYIFGGYTVAKDGSEKSTPEVFRFDPKRMKYKRMKDMPTPVDDMVTFTYKDRYIYLISGWHDDANVNLVQIYDTKKNRWKRGSDYPGTPVFGHAGGIVGNRFVIADGVAVIGKTEKGRRVFGTVNEGWMGTIDPKNYTKITYRRLPQLPRKGHYRIAGAGDENANQVTFAGGTDNAYNYNGIGYNGIPANPSKHVFAWNFTDDSWVALKDKPVASMDHRGMVNINGEWFTIGGLNEYRDVINNLLPIK